MKSYRECDAGQSLSDLREATVQTAERSSCLRNIHYEGMGQGGSTQQLKKFKKGNESGGTPQLAQVVEARASQPSEVLSIG